MASSKIFMVISFMSVFVHSVLAIEHLVGDETGWTTNFDYQAWANGKEFHVGDKLVFKYPARMHNVLKVNGTGFQECTAPAATTDALTSGEDEITLTSPGKKWYICSVGKHCESGNMKLAITVLPVVDSPAGSPFPAVAPPPSESPVSAAKANVNVSVYFSLIFAIAAILGLVVA